MISLEFVSWENEASDSSSISSSGLYTLTLLIGVASLGSRLYSLDDFRISE